MGKFLVFDAGPIISFSMSGLLPILEKLKKEFKGEFIITPEVKKELVDRPIHIRKFELEGLSVKSLLDRGILKLSTDLVDNNQLEKETNKIMEIANSCFYTDNKITLIQRGEASCLAFSSLCNCDSTIVIDERTMRMLVENPENLRELMERRLNHSIKIDKKNLRKLENFKIIRSPELAYVAYEKNLFDIKKDRILLDAVLYSLKFKGAAISSQEIEKIKSMA